MNRIRISKTNGPEAELLYLLKFRELDSLNFNKYNTHININKYNTHTTVK